MVTLELDSGDALDDIDELIDGDQLVATEIDRLAEITVHNSLSAFEAIVDVHEAPRLIPVAPNFNLVPAR